MKKIINVVAAFAITTFAHAAPYTEVVSFGDSWSDTGNFFNAVGGPVAPFSDGNFSTGLIWTEFLTIELGLTPTDESALGGRNYSWAGATALDTNTITGPGVPDILSLEDQVQEYLAEETGVANPSALYTIWGGVNDNRSGFNPTNAAASASIIAALVQDLVSAGAQHILVLNQPFADSTYSEPFNDMLATLLPDIGANVMLLDTLALYTDVQSNPAAYGLISATENCGAATFDSPLGGGTLRPDCGALFFADEAGHHSARGNQIIAQAALDVVVPLPAAMWLFCSSLLGLLGIQRIR